MTTLHYEYTMTSLRHVCIMSKEQQIHARWYYVCFTSVQMFCFSSCRDRSSDRKHKKSKHKSSKKKKKKHDTSSGSSSDES